MTAPNGWQCGDPLSDLAESWRKLARQHEEAAGDEDCEIGGDEWFLHRESAGIYRKCADELTRSSTEPARAPQENRPGRAYENERALPDREGKRPVYFRSDYWGDWA